MDVTVEGVHDHLSGALRFSTGWGTFIGVWRGGEPIRVGESTDVELTFVDDVRWDRIVVTRSGTGFLLDGDTNQVDAVVEALDPDGVATLGVGDGLVLVDTIGDPPPDPVGRSIRLSDVPIEVHPTGS
jgi:hypothetical protein